MNCATPWAPAGLVTLVRKLLSCQIRRVRKPEGTLCVRAADSINRQSACSTDSPARAAEANPQVSRQQQSANAMRIEAAPLM
jgi:hypothetical protein